MQAELWLKQRQNLLRKSIELIMNRRRRVHAVSVQV
jgi:hypothetical protein